MTSSAAGRFGGTAGGAGGDEQLLLHHPQMYYHVPQHSRREKLRFPPEETPAASTSLLLLHDPSAGPPRPPPPLYSAQNSLTAFLPSSSSTSSSPSYYSLHHPAGLGFGVTQFDGGPGALPIQPPPQHGGHHQIPSQGFSLSLSSSSSPRPPPPAARHPFPSRPAPLGPFTGYAAVLNRSRFLNPARKLLEEVCHVAHQAAGGSAGAGRELLLDTDPPRESLVDHGGDGLPDHGAMDVDRHISGPEQQWKKTTLISMLDEVCRRYKQYYQQVQAVIASFESVAGLSTAAPFASTALKAMAKHFQCLKNIISDQLRQTNKGLGCKAAGGSGSGEEISGFGLLNSNGYLQRTMTSNNDAFAQPHIWRPQRGLPERAVSVLRAWLFEHFLHPYPTDVDKQNLAKQTGLTRNQVSNWFINARVRLWKPMVEEIHTLEMRQKSKASSGATELRNRDGEQPQPAAEPSPAKSIHFGSSQQRQMAGGAAAAGKGGIQELAPALSPAGCHIQEPQMSFAYADVPNRGGGSWSGNIVSLTLGLHQNNSGSGGVGGAPSAGVCFSEQLPLNVARRFGLEECNDGYLVGAFGGGERPFGKDVGGRLLHDFVG